MFRYSYSASALPEALARTSLLSLRFCTLTGRPRSKCTRSVAGSLGAWRGSTVMRNMSPGAAWEGSSRMPAS